MVHTGRTYLKIMSEKQKTWRELITIPVDGKSEFKISSKKKMLADYEESTGKQGGKRQLSRIPLWYFLHEILEIDRCKELVSWEDPSRLVFTIKKPKELAALWGSVKNKETMTYAKLARGIRYYYGKGVIEKYRGKRFSYKFILSKKTKPVLLRHKNLDVTEDQDKTSAKPSLKRRSADLSPSRLPKRQRSLSTASSSESTSTECSSDDDESDYNISENSDLLDSCLAEIFSDAQKMREIFSTSFDSNSSFPSDTSFPDIEVTDSNTKNTLSFNGDDEISRATIGDYGTNITTNHRKSHTESETMSFNEEMNQTSANNMLSLCRSATDFSILESFLYSENEPLTDITCTRVSTDIFLNQEFN